MHTIISRLLLTMRRLSCVFVGVLLLSGCASNNAHEFTVGLTIAQDGVAPVTTTGMGGMHILGEGTPLY